MQQFPPSEISRSALLWRRVAQTFLLFMSVTMCAGMFAQNRPSPNPLSMDDVVKLLAGDVSSKRVGSLALSRGINFQVTDQAEAELRHAGADEELLQLLRKL